MSVLYQAGFDTSYMLPSPAFVWWSLGLRALIASTTGGNGSFLELLGTRTVDRAQAPRWIDRRYFLLGGQHCCPSKEAVKKSRHEALICLQEYATGIVNCGLSV